MYHQNHQIFRQRGTPSRPLWRHCNAALFSQWVQSCRPHYRMTHMTTRTWWRHQMETFSALLAICAGNSLASGEFLAQRPVGRSFDIFFDLCLNKRLGKQSRGLWFQTLSRPIWRHSNEHWRIQMIDRKTPYSQTRLELHLFNILCSRIPVSCHQSQSQRLVTL